MFKASTVYAAYGKRQPGAATAQDTAGAVTPAQPTPTDAQDSSLAALLSTSCTPQRRPDQQAAQPTQAIRQQQDTQRQQQLRTTRSSNSHTAAHNNSPNPNLLSTVTSSSSTSSSSSTTAGTGFTLQPRTWIQQAADITDGLLDESKYKSLAVYAEVRLTEALDKAAQCCPSSIAGAAPEDCEDGQPLPNPLATAVCCQLLGELADMCGPFKPSLLRLREALLPSIYSCCSAPSLAGSRPLQFDMLPWFALAGRLRRQNNQLLEQQAVFSQELVQHQEHMVQVEQQMQSLQAALEAGTASAAALQATNAALVAEHAAAVGDAAAAAEEVKKLTAEVSRLVAELDDTQEQFTAVKEEYSNDQEQWKAELDVYMQKLHVEAHERAAGLALAAQEQQEIEQKLWEVERKLEEAEQQLQQQCSTQQAEPEPQQQLTPKPTDWGDAQELAATCKSTAETVRQLQQLHAAELAAAQRQLQLLEALTHPEPDPKPWQLNLRAETLRYFMTELEAEPSAQGSAGSAAAPSKPKLYAAGLGLGPEVPKFLRWDQPVEVADVGLQDLEAQVCQLWQAKSAHEAAHGPCSLQHFLHEHFWAEATQCRDANQCGLESAAAAAVAVAAVPEAAQSAGSPQLSTASSASQQDPGAAPADMNNSGCADGGPSDAAGVQGTTEQGPVEVAPQAAAAAGQDGVPGSQPGPADSSSCLQQPGASVAAVAAAAAEAGYRLYYACCTHRHDSAAVELLWLVLTGQLPEAVLHEQQYQLQVLVTVLQGLQTSPEATATAATAGAAGSAPKAADALPEAAASSAEAAAANVADEAGTSGPSTSEEALAAPSSTATPDPEASGTTAADVAAEPAASSSSSSGTGPPVVPWGRVLSAVQAVFQGKSQQQLQQLSAWLAAACEVHGAPGPAAASSGDGAGTGAAEPMVDAATLAALTTQLQQEVLQRVGATAAGLVSQHSSAGGDASAEAAAGAASSMSPAPGDTTGLHAAAVRQLVEGLLSQHLQALLQHSQQVWAQVQDQLQHASLALAPTADTEGFGAAGLVALPPGSHAVWTQVAQLLCSQGCTVCSSSTVGSSADDADSALARVLAAARAAAEADAASSETQAAAVSRVVGILQRTCLLMPPSELLVVRLGHQAI